jgi:hypothetical protein
VKSKLTVGLREIAESIGRGKGSFVLAPAAPGDGVTKPFALAEPFALAVGSIRTLTVNGGFTIMIGLTRDQVGKLRTMCDEALAEGAS